MSREKVNFFISAPDVVILLPFINGDIKELAVLSFLEENTGITLRSLWSLKFVKRILPYWIASALLFRGSTGIAYVESRQEAEIYRVGILREEMPEQRLHLTLPCPIDRSEAFFELPYVIYPP